MQATENKILPVNKQRVQLRPESLEPAELFVLVKKVSKQISMSKNDEASILVKKHLIQKVVCHIKSNIQGTERLHIKNFVSFFSIFSYINVVLNCEPLQIQFSNSFYENVYIYTLKIAQQWSRAISQELKLVLKINLSTLLCSFTSLITQNKKKVLNLQLSKLFSPQLIKVLLQIQFPNEEKFMKHYRILMAYVNSNVFLQHQNGSKFHVSKQLCIKSLIHHLMNCPIDRYNQLTIIHHLNKIFEDKKILNKLTQMIDDEKQMQKILKMLIQMLLDSQEENQKIIILELFGKMADKVQDLSNQDNLDNDSNGKLEKFWTGDKFLKIYAHIYNKQQNQKESVGRIDSNLQCLISKLPIQQKFTIFKELCRKRLQQVQSQQKVQKNTKFSLIQLQILQNLTKKASQQFVIYLLESGIWQKFIQIIKEEENNILSFRKFILTKIINNIIDSCRINEDICQIMKSLCEYNQIYCYCGFQ